MSFMCFQSLSKAEGSVCSDNFGDVDISNLELWITKLVKLVFLDLRFMFIDLGGSR